MAIASTYLEGETITLEYACEEALPASATVELLHPSDATKHVTASVATVPSASATVSVAASQPVPRVTCTDASPLSSGRPYLVETAAGRRQVAHVVGVGSDNVVEFDPQEPIPFPLAVGDVIRDHVLTFDAGSALTKARGWRAKWTLTYAGGATRVAFRPFDVVLQRFDLAVLDLEYLRSIAPSIPRQVLGVMPRLRAGAERMIDAWFRAHSIDPDTVWDIRAAEYPAALWIVRQAAIDRALGSWATEQMIKRMDNDLQRALKDLAGAKITRDRDGDGLITTADQGPGGHQPVSEFLL